MPLPPVDEELVLKLYESLDDLSGAAWRTDPGAGASFDMLLDATKRALISPSGPDSRALLRAIARFENVSRGIPDPDLDK